jgi:hypothetical protein
MTEKWIINNKKLITNLIYNYLIIRDQYILIMQMRGKKAFKSDTQKMVEYSPINIFDI